MTSRLGLKRSKSISKQLPTACNALADSFQNNQVKLEKVLGIGVSSGASLSCDQHTGIVAYPAGCTVVLYNGKNGVQRHLINAGRKTITCLSFSADGRFLATGECGHDPSVRVWDVEDGRQISELKGHKFGICCVAFSPQNKHLVSVGNQHDQTVNVWNWKTQCKFASNKISNKVRAISFAESGQYFVTVGVRHVKFWYLEKTKPSPVAKYKENSAVPLQGRSAILSDQRNNLFCDVVCGQGPSSADKTFCITQKGLLCEFNGRRLLDRWVDLKTSSSNSISLGCGKLFIDTVAGRVGEVSGQFDSKNGVRSIRISPDGLHLAAGNRNGSLRVYDLQNMSLLMEQEAHDGDVLCLEYSDVDTGPPYLMASASRDRLLHVFDASNNYQPVGTIDDHSGCITSVKFVRNGDRLQILSCGADKSIIFRNINTEKPEMGFDRSNYVAAQTTMYDMQVDPLQRNVYAAGQNRSIRIYSAETSKFKKSIKGALSDDGNLIKMAMDPSGSYLATSCTDKTVCLLNARTGECVAAMAGHSEYVTGVSFTSDFRHVITVSGDGCVFVWRLSQELTKNMMAKYAKLMTLKAKAFGLTSANSSAADASMISVAAGSYELTEDGGDTDSTADTDFGSVSQKLEPEPPRRKVRAKWPEPITADLINSEENNPVLELSVNVGTLKAEESVESLSEQAQGFVSSGNVKALLKRFESVDKSPVTHAPSARGDGDGQSESSPDQTGRDCSNAQGSSINYMTP